MGVGSVVSGGSGSGVEKVADATALAALSPTKGDLAVQLDTDELKEYNGVSWDVIGAASVILGISNTTTVDLTNTGGTLSADVIPAGVDHDGLANTHNLSTDIDHDGLTNTHNLTSDIDHDQLTNFDSNEHFVQGDISIPASQISDFDTEVSNNTDVSNNTSHRGSNGTDHSYIDQDVSSSASPDFAAVNTDDITEKTVDHGVEIEGTVLKDNDVTVPGDLTVNGTNVILNTTNLDVEDVNITVNKNGNQTSADDAAGLTVEMSDATDAKIIYDKDAATKFKIGESGSEVEVVDLSTSQTLTNKTIDADSNTISNLDHGSEVDNPSSGVHGVSGSVVGTSDSQAITNKDIDGGTASNSNRITLPKNTTSNLSGLTRKAGTVFYDTDEGKFKGDDGSDIIDLGGGATVIEVAQATHGFDVGEPIYLVAGDKWYSAKADSVSTVATHIVIEDTDAGNFICAKSGVFDIGTHGLVVDDYHWVSTATAGETVTTEPTSGISNPAFHVLSSTEIEVFAHYRPNVIGDGVASDSEIGIIMSYAGTSVPTGFLACEGQAISRTTYADLYSKIGVAWGVGDGSTTFNLPDGRSGFLVGAGQGDEFTVNTDRSVGDYNDDAMQGHYHDSDINVQDNNSNGTPLKTAASFGNQTETPNGMGHNSAGNNNNSNLVDVTASSTDGSNGTPRTGTETVPNSLAVKFIIRYAAKGALMGVVAAPTIEESSLSSNQSLNAGSLANISGLSNTAPTRGTYLCVGNVTLKVDDTDSATQNACIKLAIDGVSVKESGGRCSFTGTANGEYMMANAPINKVLRLEAGEVVTVQGLMDTGDNCYALVSTTTEIATYFDLIRIGDYE